MKSITFHRGCVASMFLIASLLFTASGASAVTTRVNGYIQNGFNGSFVSIVGQPGTISLGLANNISGRSSILMPFNFIYDATSYSQGVTLWVNQCGSVNFGTGTSTYYNRIAPYFNGNASSYPSAICPLTGLQLVHNGVYYLVSGAAPNRVLTVEWSNAQDYWSSAKPLISYQVKLYESSNTIEFWYSNYSISIGGEQSSYYHNVGLNGGLSPSFVQLQTITGKTNFTTPSTNYSYALPLPIELSTSPKSLVFGPVLAGSSVTLCVTATHVGTGGTLNFNSAIITGSPDFSIVSSPAGPLTAGQSDQYCVTFSPTGNGDRFGTLIIKTNGQDSGTQSISLNGSGLYPMITVDSTTLFKRTRTSFDQSLTQWVRITNSGQAPLSIDGLQTTGIDGDQYSLTSLPANPINIGVTDSVGIAYIPTREGLHVSSLIISNNSANNPTVLINLKGTGILPHIQLSSPIILFDSTKEGQEICKNLTIKNPGSDTLKISKNFLSSNDGDFQYTGLTTFMDVNIPPDQSRTVTICFTPLQQGTRQARLLLRTNIPQTFDTPRLDTAGIITVDIRGTGVPFGVFANSLDGSGVNDSSFIGVQVCRTATLKNDGDADILVKGIALTGTDKADFSYSGLPAMPFTLKARTSITFTVCGTPDKQGVLSATATITGTTGGTTISSDLALRLFGIKACVGATPPQLFETTVLPMNGSDSTLCVTINNCGDLDAIYKVTISGKNASDYTVTPLISGNVVANTGTTQFCVKFKPSAIGTSTASLDVVASDNSASVSVPLLGQGGCAVVNPTADAVPSTGVLAKSTFNVTINNTGTFEWTANAATVTPNDGVFSVLNLDKPTAPAANGAIVVQMQFAPTKLGNASAILTFPNAAPCENAPISVTLNGEGVVNGVNDATAEGFSLEQSYPNPTQGNATFTYTTPRETEVRISVVDLSGKLIRTLITGRVSEGQHSVNFDAAGIASGTYIYMLESGNTRLVRQLILTK